MTEIQSATEVSEHVLLTPGLLSTSKAAADLCYLCAQTHMDFCENGTTCVLKSPARGPPANRKLGVAEVFARRFLLSPQGASLWPVLLWGARRPSCPAFLPIAPSSVASSVWTDSFLIGYLMELFDKHF